MIENQLQTDDPHLVETFGKAKPKILILGYGRHGKDTVAHMIATKLGVTWGSSSLIALDKVIWPAMRHETYDAPIGIIPAANHKYKTPSSCFADRHNRRAEWHDLIKAYNTPDKSRLAKDVLSQYDMYVGMRCKDELAASRQLFNVIYWVDASERRPPESEDSCTVTADMADFIIPNNGSLEDLKKVIDRIGLDTEKTNDVKYTIRGLPAGTGLSINESTGFIEGELTESDDYASPVTATVRFEPPVN